MPIPKYGPRHLARPVLVYHHEQMIKFDWSKNAMPRKYDAALSSHDHDLKVMESFVDQILRCLAVRSIFNAVPNLCNLAVKRIANHCACSNDLYYYSLVTSRQVITDQVKLL